MKNSLDQICFGTWNNSVHHNQKAINSLRKAPSTVPDSVDKCSESGVFTGGRGEQYVTTLNSCTCKSFVVNGKKQIPCKHIYGLAVSLGYLSIDDCDPFTLSDGDVTAIAFEKDRNKRESMINSLSADEIREVLIRILRTINSDASGV